MYIKMTDMPTKILVRYEKNRAPILQFRGTVSSSNFRELSIKLHILNSTKRILQFVSWQLWMIWSEWCVDAYLGGTIWLSKCGKKFICLIFQLIQCKYFSLFLISEYNTRISTGNSPFWRCYIVIDFWHEMLTH